MFRVLKLSEATTSEVMARVSLRVLHYRYRRHYAHVDKPTRAMELIAHSLKCDGWEGLASWVSYYNRLWSPTTPTSHICQQFISRAQQGYSWRSVVFPEYKRHRCDPRVTNRGVANSGEERGEAQWDAE